MLRTSFLLVAALAVFMFSTEARAAEPNGSVDQSALAAMGLGGLQAMSDTEGKNVRGTSYHPNNYVQSSTYFKVSGSSYTHVNNVESAGGNNSYYGTATNKNGLGGENLSWAVGGQVSSGFFGPTFNISGAAAGGSSSVYAW
ncbi:hypothetical protein GC197_17215 [bacterium]|nr:hypothetical protein [bacterium]